MSTHPKSRPGKRLKSRQNQAVSGGPSPAIRDLTPFILNRRLNEVTLFNDTGGAWQNVNTPGFTGASWINMGTVGADVAALGTWYWPFTTVFQLNSLAQSGDLMSTFLEYQVRSLDPEFTLITSMAQGPVVSIMGGVNVSTIPEVLLVVDPDSATLYNLVQLLCFQNVTRHCLSERPVRKRVVPRAAVNVNSSSAGGISTAYTDKTKDLWFDISNNQTQFFGITGAFRNWYAPAAVAGPVALNSHVVRVGGSVQLACRRMH